MKVLFLTHRLPYTANRGDRIRAMHLLRVLSRQADVHLLSLVHSDEEAEHAADVEQVARSVTAVRVSTARNYPRAVHSLVTQRPLTHALLHAPGIAEACRRIVESHRPDVVLSYCSGMARLALEPPLNHLPFVLDMVDVDSEKWRLLSQKTRPPFSWVYGAEARTLSAFEARAARAAHAVLVVNERERDAMQRIEPSARVHVVPIGVALDDLRPPEAPAPEPNVVFCGVMNYKPNEEAAVWFATEVWPRVRARHSSARFSLVGSNPTPAVRRLAEQDPSIEVTGTVPDVRPYLWRSAVAVAPLLLARGVQNKVLEAVAAGLPCVITPAVHDGLPEAVLPSCVRAEHPSDFADAVIALLNTAPDQRRGIAELAEVQALGWDEQLAPVMGILEAARRAAASPQSSVA